MTNGPGDSMELSIWPSLCADLHSKDEAVLKVAQRVQDSPRRAGMAELADAADSKSILRILNFPFLLQELELSFW
jgi:hypothetical protein